MFNINDLTKEEYEKVSLKELVYYQAQVMYEMMKQLQDINKKLDNINKK